MHRIFVWSAAVAVALPALAQGPAPLPVPRVYALQHGTVVPAPGERIEDATIVVRDGLVEAVGVGVPVPPEARLVDLEGRTVHAGLIDAYVERAWPDPLQKAEEASPGLHPNGLIRPERQMALVGLEAGPSEQLRAAGITTVAVAPSNGIFRGVSAVLTLADGDTGARLLRPRWAQHVAFDSNSWGGGYPSSTMGSVALFRQSLLDADWHRRAVEGHLRRPAQQRPDWSSAWEALAPVAAGEQPVLFRSSDPLDTLRFAGLARELGLEAIVVGNGSEYQRLEPIGRSGLPHVLPVALPEPPRARAEIDPNVELADLRHWDRAPENPAAMVGTGLPIAFTSHGSKSPGELHGALARAIERGLTPEDALAGWTVVPARLLGIDRVAGTIEPGKIANLVVSEGELFEEETKVTQVWVDGVPYEVTPTAPPEVDPIGTWELTVATGAGEEVGSRLVLGGTPESPTGSIEAMGSQADLASVQVSGRTVLLSFDGTPFGFPGTLSMSLEVQGDSLSGTGTSPMGPFTVTGHRIATSSPEVTR